MTRLVRVSSVCMLVAAAAVPTAAAEVPGHLAAFRAQVGFDGVYRTGSWTPLVVVVDDAARGSSAAVNRLFVSVEDADGQWVRSPAAVVATADGRHVARFCVRFGRPSGRAAVETTDGVAASLTLPPPLPSTDPVLLVLGDLPAMDRAVRLLAGEDGPRPRIARLPTSSGPPGIGPRDFDGADAIVVCGRATLAHDADVLAAIDGWVRRGGRLVFAAGQSAIDLAEGGVAATWLPGPVARTVPLRRAAPIESFARCPRPLDRSAVAGLEVPVFTEPRRLEGVIEAHEGTSPTDLPLVVRRAHGLGTITWLGVDLDQPVFARWPGTDMLLVELIGALPTTPPRSAAAGRAGETNRLALDLAGQLRRAIDRFPGVLPVPFEWIALLGAAVVAALYPLDWWLTRGAPPWRAWLTLPAVVLVMSGLIWTVSQRWHGTAWKRSGTSVIDIDAATRLVRGTSWAGVWSPANAALDVVARPPGILAATTADAAISWWADSGRGIGATDAPVAHPSLAAAGYGYDGSASALGAVPIAASSSRLFMADWVATLSESPVSAALAREAQGTLRGSVVHHLPFALDGCVLVHAGWLYDVGRLEPGRPFDVSAGRGPRSLAAVITRRTQSKDRDVAVRWDPSAADIDRILEIAGFHAAIGGSSYSSLEPGQLDRLDVSPLLAVDRAVLVGRGPAGTDWMIAPPPRENATADPASLAGAVWRIVMPLETTPEPSRP